MCQSLEKLCLFGFLFLPAWFAGRLLYCHRGKSLPAYISVLLMGPVFVVEYFNFSVYIYWAFEKAVDYGDHTASGLFSLARIHFVVTCAALVLGGISWFIGDRRKPENPQKGIRNWERIVFAVLLVFNLGFLLLRYSDRLLF